MRIMSGSNAQVKLAHEQTQQTLPVPVRRCTELMFNVSSSSFTTVGRRESLSRLTPGVETGIAADSERYHHLCKGGC